MGESVDPGSQVGPDDVQVGIEDIVVEGLAENEVAPVETGAAPVVALDAPDVAADVADTTADAPDVAEAAVSVTPAEAAPDEIDALATDLEAEDAEQPTESLDDIQPTPAPEITASFDGAPALAHTVPWWPFLVYLGAWVALAGVAVWQLLQLPAAQASYESAAYGVTILGGVVMTAVGPLLILAVWFATRANRSSGARGGLLTSALLKGALATLSGAIIWWGALVIVDYLRLGTPL